MQIDTEGRKEFTYVAKDTVLHFYSVDNSKRSLLMCCGEEIKVYSLQHTITYRYVDGN